MIVFWHMKKQPCGCFFEEFSYENVLYIKEIANSFDSYSILSICVESVSNLEKNSKGFLKFSFLFVYDFFRIQ